MDVFGPQVKRAAKEGFAFQTRRIFFLAMMSILICVIISHTRMGMPPVGVKILSPLKCVCKKSIRQEEEEEASYNKM